MVTKALKKLLRTKGEIPERYADHGVDAQRRAMVKADVKRARRAKKRSEGK